MISTALFLPERKHLRILSKTTSTNDAAKRWARDGARDGAVVVADCQTAGRGRSDRSWHSPPGLNLYISYIIRSSLQFLRLAPILGVVAVREAIQTQLPAACKPVIKWPNDILVHGAKIAGILIEIETQPDPFCIVGIGINVNADICQLPPAPRTRASSLRIESGRIMDRNVVLASVVEQLDNHRQRLALGGSGLLEAFTSHCISLGKQVRVNIPGHDPFLATACGLDHQGRLLVQDHENRCIPIIAADVDFI